MTRIKICGITTEQEAGMVSECLPDYAGLVFAPGRRQLTLAQAKALAKHLHPRIRRAGVFVNQPRSFIEVCIETCGLSVVQLHGSESPEDCLGYSCSVWKAFRVRGQETLQSVKGYHAEAYVLDAYDPLILGGSGRTFDWSLLRGAPLHGPLVLAGGLNPENVADALRIVNPWCVDVSSGVEFQGKKDLNSIQQFISCVRRHVT